MTPPSRPVVAVVGGGIAGLAAAWELVAGPEGLGTDRPDVHVFESAGHTGGKLVSAEFAGRCVDLAADAFLARRPEATDLCAELGLESTLVPVGAQGASIWARGRLRMMPDGLNLGVPTRWLPLLRSGILSPAESVRAATDLWRPHLGTATAFGDRPVGQIVEERLGRPVVDRLVDPLVGGIHAGGVDELSAAATFPLLLAASHQSGSLMRRLGRVMAKASSKAGDAALSPAFWSLPGSTASLAGLLTDALVARGVTVHTGTRVRALERVGPSGGSRRPGGGGGGGAGSGAAGTGGGGRPAGTEDGWRLMVGGPDRAPAAGGARPGGTMHGLVADGVVLALPASKAAALLAPHSPVASRMLDTVMYASVAVVTLRFPEAAVTTPLRGTGFLVPRTSTIEGRAPMITGVTYLSRKWPHLARPGDELIRASVGRFGDARHALLDDDELTASVLGELARFLGIHDPPSDVVVTRWDDALPQYEVGHLLRVARIEEALSQLDSVAMAGAALRGVGIPACIGSGRAAGRQVLASLRPGVVPAG